MMRKAPEDFVPAEEQAHSQGLLVIWEVAKLLDLDILDLVDEWREGRIEVATRCNNLPCFSLPAIDAYRAQVRPAQAS
jgi:hypothetical protein